MTLEALRRDKRESILQAAKKYGAGNIRVFGSVARGEAAACSDVDFLVDLESGWTLMDLGGFLSALEELLDTEVDVATERRLKPNVREQVLRDATPLCGMMPRGFATFAPPSTAFLARRSVGAKRSSSTRCWKYGMHHLQIIGEACR